MSIFTYPQSKVIDEVTFKKTANGGIRAYLHACDNAQPEMLQNVLAMFRESNLEYVPYTMNGKPAVEVRGFKDEARLIGLLDKHKLIEGNGRIIEETDDKITWMDRFKKRTLQLSGVAYLIGDYGFWTYNRKEADGLGMAGAFSYFLGTLALVFYGRNDQSNIQVEDLAKELQGFLEKEKIVPTEGSALHDVAKSPGKNVIESLNNFCKRYPSEIFNSVTALAGAFVAASAYKKVRHSVHIKDPIASRAHKIEGWKDVGLGVTTVASGILATVVKEKKPDPDEPAPKNPLKWLWCQIQAHPLAIAGGGYTISTMFHASSTWDAYWEAKRTNDQVRLDSVPRRALFVGMALLSEFLLAISSKGHGQGVVSDNSVDNTVIALAADLIAMQPSEKRTQLIDSLASHLSKPDVLAMKDDEVRATLRQQVETLHNNPWVKVHASQPKTLEKPQPLLTSEREKLNWQAKVSAPKPDASPTLLA